MNSSQKLNFDFKFSKTTLNHASNRDMYVEYCNMNDKSSEYHLVVITLDANDCSDAGIYFRVNKYDNYEFVAELREISYYEERDKITEYFDKNGKTIKGEKELRKALNDLHKLFN